MAYQLGDKVTWIYESRWGWGYRIPATVRKVGRSRVTIEVEKKQGGTRLVSVKPENLRVEGGQS